MFVRRELKRYHNRYGKYLDPIGILALIAIFILPILAVINISPETKTPTPNRSNVLGAQVQGDLEVKLMEGTHSVITSESLKDAYVAPLRYTYSAVLLSREAGSYSKPLVEITNPTDENVSFRFNILEQPQGKTEVGIYLEDKNFIILDAAKEKYAREFTIPANSDQTYYLYLTDTNTVNFNQEVSIQISEL